MKKYSLYLMEFVVGLIILLGVLLILFANEQSFKKIVNDDIENISKLSSSTIYAEIDNSLTKPIYVGQTMANDMFLKNWLSEEVPQGNDPTQIAAIKRYLSDYQKKYNYDSVFIVSQKSGVYYHQNGVNKVISHDDAHDVWYYDFIESSKAYDLDVDIDEANNQLTVFVNCRITDNDGKLMGAVGVGIKMVHLQELLKKYETEYDLKAFLMNEDGLIQVDSVVENIEKVNFFANAETLKKKEDILSDKNSMKIFWYPEGGSDHCLITKYVDNLDWYIVVEKNTVKIQKILCSQINSDLLFVAIIILLVLLMVSYIISKYNRILLKTASVDDVTNLPNSKMFQEIFRKNAKRPACLEGMLFMFDIDRFKYVNDKFGHLFGNTVLYRVSEVAKNTIGDNGVVARWGGDEFVGVIYGSKDSCNAIIKQLAANVSNIVEGDLSKITISVGTTAINYSANLDMYLGEADIAMYKSKENGRNQITSFK